MSKYEIQITSQNFETKEKIFNIFKNIKLNAHADIHLNRIFLNSVGKREKYVPL